MLCYVYLFERNICFLKKRYMKSTMKISEMNTLSLPAYFVLLFHVHQCVLPIFEIGFVIQIIFITCYLFIYFSWATSFWNRLYIFSVSPQWRARCGTLSLCCSGCERPIRRGILDQSRLFDAPLR